MDLTDEQWAVVSQVIPDPPRRADERGRPWKPARAVLNGVLWILRTGSQWQDLPNRYPSYQTCHRRFHAWVLEGTLERAFPTLALDLKEHGDLDLSECFIDGTFVATQKGGARLVRPSGAKVQNHGSGRPRWSTGRHLYRDGDASRGYSRPRNASDLLCG